MATIFTRWIARRKERRARKRLKETGTTLKGDAPQSFSDFTPTSPPGSGGLVTTGGGGGGGTAPTAPAPTAPAPKAVVPERAPLTVEAAREPTRALERTSFRLRRTAQEVEQRVTRGEKVPIKRRAVAFGAGAAIPFIEFPGRVVGLGKGLVTRPFETIVGIPAGLKREATEIGVGLAGRAPEAAVGRIAGEYLLFKGIGKIPKGVTKVSDIARTVGKREIAAEKIIAPEYPAQIFPKIRPRQTAQELLKEFAPIKELKEVRPAGFTAAPRPFAKVTEAGVGTSELPGVYQAPRVSPRFLRLVGEERRIISISPFETFRPTITRITPEAYELVPGIRPGAKVIRPEMLPKAREFLMKAPKEKAYVPFLKTEKEAIIPPGAQLRRIRKEAFIKFEGRRIPIHEFEVVKKPRPPRGVIKERLPTAGEISESLSRRRLRETAIIDPSSLIKLSRRVSRPRPSRGISMTITPVPMIFSRVIPPPRRRITPLVPPSRIISAPPSRPRYIFEPTPYPAPPAYKEFYPIPKKKKVVRPGEDIGWEDPFKSLVARRKFKETPSLADVTAFQMGYKIPKRKVGGTGLVGYGIGEKLPKIELGSLLGKVKKTSSSNKYKKNKKKK